ncbi:amino acid adenylation domain protein [Candidatus Moduliflexus flocculans]|uniref:Amino acid adenylation domain protein n=1 Tax=Candidatus Moduliflexus flocculans TaxID=1499966 RepID=A0A0S6VRY5_9BACT|nr:amino acid adenylation domain protein [Candidatus Moduliflexus flocculans]
MNYWRSKLAAPLPTLDLPADRPRPPQQTFRGAKYLCEIPEEIAARIEALSKAEKCTLSTTLLAAFKTLLFRYTGQEDVIVGSPAANRGRVELERLIGFFANTIVLRDDLSGNPTFRDLLRRVHRTALEAQAYQHVPFDALVEELHPARDLSHTPFFQTMFVLQSFEIHDTRMGDIRYQPLDAHTGTAKFDQTWELFRTPRGLLCSIEYNTDLFDEATIRRMAGHYQTLLTGIAAQPGAHLSDYTILTDAERHQILVEWNRTEAAYPLDQCVHQLVEAQAERTPDAVALIFGEEQMTYRELNQRANQLAHYLKQCGVTPNMLVGIHLDRSFEMLIGLLGILKAGGVYLPLDPAFPTERLHFMADDAQISVLVTQTSLQTTFASSRQTIHIICVDADWPKIAEYPDTMPVTSTTSEQLCYILYTSGSTGKPKGVQITHRNFVNFLCAMQKQPGIQPTDVLLAVTTLSFDIAGLELFLPLISGARIVLARKEDTYDGSRLLHYFQHAGITMMQATPVSWRLLIAAGWDGTPAVKALCGGEALPYDLKQQLIGKTSSLWNMYGPTETTIWSTVDQVLPTEDVITIGRPIANTQMYILDRHFQPVPVGILGDLYIGGEGVSPGYFHRPELSQERFLANPFNGDQEARIYRTGDLARYRADGRIEFFGRSDFQVKIRGYRIELGEIETVLAKHPAILEVVVVARGDADHPQLAAYIVFAEQKIATEQELRDWLKRDVPDYMIPATFTFLSAMPLTPNGKVDRRALPDPERQAALQEETFAPPRTALERQIAEVWAEAFGMFFVGIHDNFFLLGGQSLLAMQVAAKLSVALRQPVNVRLLFQHPTIAKLAAALETLPAQEIAEPPACCQAQPPERPAAAEQPAASAELFTFEHRPLLSLYAVGKLPPCDAVALDYLTEGLIRKTGLEATELIDRWCQHLPTLYNISDTPWGRIGYVMLPFTDTELFGRHAELLESAADAIETARLLGARTVAFTGLLAFATNYCRDMQPLLAGRANLPSITTGHGAISSAYILNLQAILQQSGRQIAEERVAFIDLGSLGGSVLRLMLRIVGHPAEILLCDLPHRAASLETMRRDIIERFDFQGDIRIVALTPEQINEAYAATLFISAFQIAGLLDIGKVQPGALIVGPACFEQAALLTRLQERGDLLATVGGVVRLPSPIRESAYRPRALEQHLTSGILEEFNAKGDSHDLPSCAFSSLLSSCVPGIAPTVGEVDEQDALPYYEALQRLECQGTALHVGNTPISPEIIQSFRQRFGRGEK